MLRHMKYLFYSQLCLGFGACTSPPAVSTLRGEKMLRLRKLETDLYSTCVTNGGEKGFGQSQANEPTLVKESHHR